MRRLLIGREIAGAVTVLLLAACGAAQPSASVHSPSVTGSPAASSSPANPSPGVGSSPSPSASAAQVRLVIVDLSIPEVRLAGLDAVDIASVKGQFDGIVGDQVIILNGTALEALNRNGTLRKLGKLAGSPDWLGPETVLLSPSLSQWIYTIHDASFTAKIHLGTSTSDKVIATLPSPDGNSTYQPFAWNASGVYMVHQPYGLGGAGPFLDYHFALVKFDMTTGKVTDVSPQCIVYRVLDDGTMICRKSTFDGHIEIRSPSGHINSIQLTIGGPAGPYDAAAYIDVAVSPDGTRLIAGRNGSKDPVINYQMAVADLTAASAKAFGPLDYVPNAWLPDGRVIATHQCAYSGWGGGPCNAALDGTYFFSANGTSHKLFYNLKLATVVGYV
jgi:hypothetical protein